MVTLGHKRLSIIMNSSEMIENRTVSVIVPAYCVEACLRQCLDSVFAQTVAPAEVIVINDGSTDGTAEVARSYGDQIVYLEQDNQGQGTARNAGFRIATCEYVALLDADDYWLPDFLKETVAFLIAHPETVAVSTGYVIRRRRQRQIGPSGLLASLDGDGRGQILDNFFDTWAKHDHVRTGTVLMRRSVIGQAGPQLEIRISQDLEYWGYLATFGPWGFIPKPLWAGDSYFHAMQVGWLARYQKRRKACPTVEEWQHRIVPRLKPADWTGFRTVRGRVAARFTHSMIIAGNREAARKIVAEYGADMGTGRLAKLLRLGDACGLIGWRLACTAISLREHVRACRIVSLIKACIFRTGE